MSHLVCFFSIFKIIVLHKVQKSAVKIIFCQQFVNNLDFNIKLLRKKNEDWRLQVVVSRNNGDVIVIIWILYEIVALIYKSTIDISSFSNYKCCLLWLKLTDFKNCYIQFPRLQVSSCIKYYLFYWFFNYSCSCLCLYISISKTFNCSIGHILSSSNS